MLHSFLNLFRRRVEGPKFDGVKVVEKVSDLPEDLKNNIFLIKRASKPIWAVMDCPCGRGHRLMVNLVRRTYPYWRVKEKRNTVTLSPSLWLEDQCGSHFFIINNHVEWARYSGPTRSQTV